MRSSSVVSIGLRSAGAVALAVTTTALAAACGSRGPLDDEPVADASVADVQSADVSVEAEPPPVDASKPLDAGRESGTIIDCGVCLIGQCSPAILACIQSPGCISAFQCVVTDCLGAGGGGAGGVNPLCLFKCAQGDPAGALQVLQIFQCVTGECGADCSSVLGGLLGGGLPGGGGFPGGGGGGGTKKDAGTKDGGKNLMSPAQQSFARAFSAWPELCGPLLEE